MNPLPGDLFSRRLRQERERLSISQAELARRIAGILGTNVDPSAVTRIEQQTRAVRLDEAVAAAEALDVPLATLLSGDSMIENEAQLQQSLVDLAIAQREWEKYRIEVQRLMRIVATLGGGSVIATPLDPDLLDAVDARIPVEEDQDQAPRDATQGHQGTVTDPDA